MTSPAADLVLVVDDDPKIARLVEAYLALPYAYATTRDLEGGKTPLDLLRAQLQLLDEKLDEITDAVHRRLKSRRRLSRRPSIISVTCW